MLKHRVTAGAMLALHLSSQPVRAEPPGLVASERWSCSEQVASGSERPTEYLVENGYMIAQPLGAPRYRVLDNTPHGVIGVDSSAELEIGFVDIYVATLMINRANGRLSATNATGAGTPEARSGQCRLAKPPGPSAQR